MTAGFHTSEDLCTWTFHVLPENLPANDYAPDGCVLNGDVQLCASHGSKNGSFYRSRDPLAAPFREIPGTFPFWDPHQFVDDDGRLYFYWGCSNAQPILGVEMDRNTMHPLGEPVPLIAGHPEQLGYERMGEDGSDENSAPWIEGRVDDKAQRKVLPAIRRPPARNSTPTQTAYTRATIRLGRLCRRKVCRIPSCRTALRRVRDMAAR